MTKRSTDHLDKLAALLIEALPRELGSLKADAGDTLRVALAAGLKRLDLVTREEFDVQRAVLARTREKPEALEARPEELDG